jgi:hypothetical protein
VNCSCARRRAAGHDLQVERHARTERAERHGLVVDRHDTLAALHLLLHEILEHGVAARPGANGRFPQVSGFSFVYDSRLPAGSRVE